jgi:hypothetical protein
MSAEKRDKVATLVLTRGPVQTRIVPFESDRQVFLFQRTMSFIDMGQYCWELPSIHLYEGENGMTAVKKLMVDFLKVSREVAKLLNPVFVQAFHHLITPDGEKYSPRQVFNMVFVLPADDLQFSMPADEGVSGVRWLGVDQELNPITVRKGLDAGTESMTIFEPHNWMIQMALQKLLAKPED